MKSVIDFLSGWSFWVFQDRVVSAN